MKTLIENELSVVAGGDALADVAAASLDVAAAAALIPGGQAVAVGAAACALTIGVYEAIESF